MNPQAPGQQSPYAPAVPQYPGAGSPQGGGGLPPLPGQHPPEAPYTINQAPTFAQATRQQAADQPVVTSAAQVPQAAQATPKKATNPNSTQNPLQIAEI